ncbi:hypothetical protein [Terrisporobacter mayombei]|uniref:Uncharacterized protein n=1 Tax=Terrisporobacter mayombei TaxID=1541 RepID=A0ABY9Q4W9_9FIRM|nr:hypothetical protein [Terrisporobacter mayombei]MCC3869380.1 hypothetical protein [Terrisporobacter mayombei]WMT82211.1 hypothetical protein TEMA_25690 [Terrisporobacter mayombei]
MSESKGKSNKKKKSKKRSSYKKENTSNSNNNDKNSSNSNSSNKSNSGQTKDSKLCCFSSVDYIVLASTLAIALGEELSSTDLGILSTFFAVLSDELALIQSVNNCNSNTNNPIFVPPVADVAVTSSQSKGNENKKNIKKKK